MSGFFSREPVVIVHEGAGRIDQDCGANLQRLSRQDIAGTGDPVPFFPARTKRFDIVGRDAAPIHRRTNKLEYESRVIVMQVGIRVFKAAMESGGIDDRFLGIDGLPG